MKLTAEIIELIMEDIMGTQHLIDMAREDYALNDAKDAKGKDLVLRIIAQHTRKIAVLESELKHWSKQ